MDFAVDHGVAGISSQCGGACICTMCHCYIEKSWYDRIGPVSFDEKEMLEFVPERCPTSRLACQVIVTPLLHGLTIHIESATGKTS